MSKRGWNLRTGEKDGDRGRRLGGKAHADGNDSILDDSGRTLGQYWAQVGWFKMIEKHGREEAGRIMAKRGFASWNGQREAYSRYLGEMRAMVKGEGE